MKWKIVFAIAAALALAAWSAPYIGGQNETEVTQDYISQLARKAQIRDSIVFIQYRVRIKTNTSEFYPSLEEFKPVLTRELVNAQDEYDKMYISYLKFRMEMFSNKLNKSYNEEFKKIYTRDNYVNIEHSDLGEADGIRQDKFVNDFMDSLVQTERLIAIINTKNKKLREQYKELQSGH